MFAFHQNRLYFCQVNEIKNNFMTSDIDHLSLLEPTAGILDRIRYLIRLSRRNQQQFSRLIGIDPSNLSKILSGRMPVTEQFVNRLVANLGVSKLWLCDGTDIPFPRGVHAREISVPQDAGDTLTAPAGSVSGAPKGAPIYDIDVTAGSRELSRMFTVDNIIGYLDLPGVNPDCAILRVSGDSMVPRLRDGSYIAIRPVSDRSPIAWGQIYVVVVEDYRFVKFVRRHPDPTMVILHSANPDYDDIELPRRDILSLYLVESILNYDVIA